MRGRARPCRCMPDACVQLHGNIPNVRLLPLVVCKQMCCATPGTSQCLSDRQKALPEVSAWPCQNWHMTS